MLLGFNLFVAGYVEPLLLLNNVVAQLDVTISLAVACASAPNNYIRPKILPIGNNFNEYFSYYFQ